MERRRTGVTSCCLTPALREAARLDPLPLGANGASRALSMTVPLCQLTHRQRRGFPHPPLCSSSDRVLGGIDFDAAAYDLPRSEGDSELEGRFRPISYVAGDSCRLHTDVTIAFWKRGHPHNCREVQ